MVQVLDVSQLDRTEWLKLRRKGIGGSDVAAICGLSRWKSAISVYLEKTTDDDPVDDGPPSEAAYWGTMMEDMLAKEFQKRTGMEVREMKHMLFHPEQSWAFANIDRYIAGGGILECKTASEWLHDAWKQDSIPEYYMVQLQWYFYVTGLTWGYFSTLVGGNKYYWYRVERDGALIEKLVAICQTFWENYVIPGVPPQFDGSEDCVKLLKTLYPIADPDAEVELEDEHETLLAQLAQAKKDKKDADYRETEAENRLKALIQDRELAHFRGKLACTWKTQADTRFDVTTFQKEHPELYEQFVKTKPVRKFLLKWKG